MPINDSTTIDRRVGHLAGSIEFDERYFQELTLALREFEGIEATAEHLALLRKGMVDVEKKVGLGLPEAEALLQLSDELQSIPGSTYTALGEYYLRNAYSIFSLTRSTSGMGDDAKRRFGQMIDFADPDQRPFSQSCASLFTQRRMRLV